MAQQHINLGTQSDGKDGDTNRVAWIKAESNFGELYAGMGDLVGDMAGLLLAGSKNLLINGSFDIWQRATSIASGSGVRYCADRWLTQSGGGATNNVSQQTAALGDASFEANPRYYARVGVTSGNAVGSYATFTQKVEGARALIGKPAVLSFKCRADAPKKLGIEIEVQYGTGGSTTDTFRPSPMLDVGTSFQRYVVPIVIPASSGKTTGGNDATAINFWLDSGANYSARSSGVPYQSGWFEFAEVQLEYGNEATPIERRPIGTELALCQRYTRLVQGGGMAGIALSPTAILLSATWPTMRATPNITLLKTSWSAATYELLVGGSWATAANCSLQGPSASPQGVTVQVLGFSGLTTGQPAIISNAATNVLLLEAEL